MKPEELKEQITHWFKRIHEYDLTGKPLRVSESDKAFGLTSHRFKRKQGNQAKAWTPDSKAEAGRSPNLSLEPDEFERSPNLSLEPDEFGRSPNFSLAQDELEPEVWDPNELMWRPNFRYRKAKARTQEKRFI